MVTGVAGAVTVVGCVGADCCRSGASAVQASRIVPAATAAMAAEMIDCVLIVGDVEIGFRKCVVRVLGLWVFELRAFSAREKVVCRAGPTLLEIV